MEDAKKLQAEVGQDRRTNGAELSRLDGKVKTAEGLVVTDTKTMKESHREAMAPQKVRMEKQEAVSAALEAQELLQDGLLVAASAQDKFADQKRRDYESAKRALLEKHSELIDGKKREADHQHASHKLERTKKRRICKLHGIEDKVSLHTSCFS